MIDKNNVHRHELIGLQVAVAQSVNKANIGIHGKIVDETQKTLVIRQGKETKRVFKNNTMFNVELPSGEMVELDGEKIAKRSWERIKM